MITGGCSFIQNAVILFISGMHDRSGAASYSYHDHSSIGNVIALCLQDQIAPEVVYFNACCFLWQKIKSKF